MWPWRSAEPPRSLAEPWPSWIRKRKFLTFGVEGCFGFSRPRAIDIEVHVVLYITGPNAPTWVVDGAENFSHSTKSHATGTRAAGSIRGVRTSQAPVPARRLLWRIIDSNVRCSRAVVRGQLPLSFGGRALGSRSDRPVPDPTLPGLQNRHWPQPRTIIRC